jgi:hypothetical protein
MRRLFFIYSIAVLAIGYSSCNIINPKEPTPYFIQIDSVTVKNTDYSLHGEVSQKITDVWVYYNNNLLGGYELPAHIPIIGDTVGSIDIQAGVLRNGMNGDRAKYPYYKLNNYPINWTAGTCKKIYPIFQYVSFDEMKMLQHEDFEIGNSFTPLNTDTPIVKSFNAKYGNRCGLMYLDANHTQSENIITEKLALAYNTVYFLEMDYQCDVPITVNLLCTSASGTSTIVNVGGVNPKDKWNKMYFDIGQVVSNVRAKDYNIIISAYKPSSQSTGYAYIDNIKLIGPRK